MADTTERHLPPSAKRLLEARRDGQVALSRDLSSALGSLAATGVLVGMGAVFASRMVRDVAQTLHRLGDAPTRDITPNDLVSLVLSGAALLALTAGPVALAAAGAGLFSSLAQTRFNVTTRALGVKWERLSPQNGFSRLAPSKAGVDTLKAIVVAAVLAFLAWRAGVTLSADAARLTFASPADSAHRAWSVTIRLLWQAGGVALALGAADFGLQKYRYLQSLKMSHQEQKEEAKEDSNPEIKGRIRRIQREMHRRRMLQAVSKATVVITNPTHFAVALEYNRDRSPAPIVVGKGADLMAAKIRQIAREHSVPIMENPPLARALYRECEVGDTIPGPLFGAVAEVLAYLVRIKQLVI